MRVPSYGRATGQASHVVYAAGRPDLLHPMMSFRSAEGTRILPNPTAATRAPAGALRREVLDRPLIASEHHLHLVLAEYLRHHSAARPHCPWPARTRSSAQPAIADQPRRAPDPPKTSPQRTHTSATSPSDGSRLLLPDDAGHRLGGVFEPRGRRVPEFGEPGRAARRGSLALATKHRPEGSRTASAVPAVTAPQR